MSRAVVIIVVLLFLVATPILPWSGTPVEASWCSPWIDHLEFTQGVQQGLDPLDPVMDPALPPGSDQPEPVVPLIKNRALAVRAYVRSFGFCDPDEVWMTLYAENNGQQVWDRFNMATRGAVKVHPIPYWNRTDDAETFNVRMWPQEDSLTFEACVGTWVCQEGSPPPGSANHCEMEETPHCVTQTVAFESREQPSIAGIPINYRAAEFEPKGPPAPSDEQYISEGYAERIAEALWPLPDGPGGYDYRESQEFLWEYSIDGDWEEADEPLPEGAVLNEPRIFALYHSLLSFWEDSEGTDNDFSDADYLIAWMPNGVLLGGIASRANRLAIADAHHTSPLYLAHELGHLFDYNDEPNVLPAGQVGWDVLLRTPGLVAFEYENAHARHPNLVELMVSPIEGPPPDEERWTSQSHYSLEEEGGFFMEWAAGRAYSLHDPPPVSQYYLVHGAVSDDPALPDHLRPTMRYEDRVDLEPVAAGDAVVRVVDSQQSELYATHVEAAEQDGYLFTVPVPASPSAAAIELRKDGILLHELVRSAYPPVVDIISPTSGAIVTDSLRVQWLSSDADGDELVANVAYSRDGGTTWMALKALTRDGEYTIDTARLPATSHGVVRVRVSDGFNTTDALVSGLEAGTDRAPNAFIKSPRDGAEIPQGTNIVLLCGASDFDDGAVPDDRITWHSSVDGFLGHGPALNVVGPPLTDQPMTLGTHVIEVRVEDSNGNTAVDSVTVLIE